MADLVGPKFKIGNVFWTGCQLEDWLDVTVAIGSSEKDVCRLDQSSGGVLITLPPTAHAGFLRGLKVGSEIRIEEGRQVLKVSKRISESKVCSAIVLCSSFSKTAIST
jgi:hypothetical protein